MSAKMIYEIVLSESLRRGNTVTAACNDAGVAIRHYRAEFPENTASPVSPAWLEAPVVGYGDSVPASSEPRINTVPHPDSGWETRAYPPVLETRGADVPVHYYSGTTYSAPTVGDTYQADRR